MGDNSSRGRFQRDMKVLTKDLAPILLYAGLTTAETWPLAWAPSQRYIEHVDVFAGVWALNEMARRLVQDPLHLFDANAFYPFSNTLATLDHHFSSALFAIPARAMDPSPFFAYNVVVLASFVLTGFFTYLLVRRLSGSAIAGLVAGCALAFSNFRFTHLVHLHLLSTEWLPLCLLALHYFLDAPSWKRLVWLTGSAVLMALASWQMALLGGLAVAWVGMWLMLGDHRPAKKRLAMLSIGAVVVSIALLPFVNAYTKVSAWQPQRSDDAQSRLLSRLATSIEGVFTPGPAGQPYLPSRDIPEEGRIFPGVVVLLLAAYGAAVRLRPRRRREGIWGRMVSVLLWSSTLVFGVAIVAAIGSTNIGARVLTVVRPLGPFVLVSIALVLAGIERARISHERQEDAFGLAYLALALLGVGLAMGPRLYFFGTDLGPGILPAQLLPDLFRAPSRFSLLMVQGLAVLAGFGTAELLKRLPGSRVRAISAVAILGALNLDLWTVIPQLSFAPERPGVYQWLTDNPEPGAIIEFPIEQGNWAAVNSFLHDRRLVNGPGLLRPPQIRRLADENAFTPSALADLWEHFHPRFVVLRSAAYSSKKRQEVLALIEQQPTALQLRARSGPDYVFELLDRGSAPALYRRWPREALEGKRLIEWRGAVESLPDDAAPVLELAFNGRMVSRVEGVEATQSRARIVELRDVPLIDGINTIEIRATYRRPKRNGAVAGQTPDIPADIEVVSASDHSFARVNGREMAADKGYLIVVLDRVTGDILQVEQFNTSWFEEDSARLAAFVRALTPGTPVVLVSEFDVSRRLTAAAVDALRSLGLSSDPRGYFGWAHAAIAIKGAAPGSVLESFRAETATLYAGSPARPRVTLSGLTLR